MELTSFRIQNFRSIVDTGWCNLSNDSITCLIGQNEAGKTSILEALYSFYTKKISIYDLRNDKTLPIVSCSFKIENHELVEIFKGDRLNQNLVEEIKKHNRINLIRGWENKEISKLELEEEEIKSIFKVDEIIEETDEASTNVDQVAGTESEGGEEVAETESEGGEEVAETESEDGEEVVEEKKEEIIDVSISEDKFVDKIFKNIPIFVLFRDFESLLPDQIDFSELLDSKKRIEGKIGAKNLLKIADVNMEILEGDDIKQLQYEVENKNKDITADFQDYWQQKVSDINKVNIQIVVANYGESEAGKAGKKYLAFFVNDDSEKLYPKQRSKGLRWFLSFYLQLRSSSEAAEKRGSVYLIDEPGGSLHGRAQEDVLKVFEELKKTTQVIYTTHSPYMISLKTVYRILAVWRADADRNKSQTEVISAHSFSSASSDTLSPLYTLMGADFSNQLVIKDKRNILLEEISAYYYLSAFSEFIDMPDDYAYIPARGTSKIPQLANMFLGWGLEFIIVMDNDSSARRVYKELKKNLYQDDEEIAKQNMIKIKECDGIEDLFNKSDFKKFILADEEVSYDDSNSIYMKDSGRSKAVAALEFMLEVKKGNITFDKLGKLTQSKISGLMEDITVRLD